MKNSKNRSTPKSNSPRTRSLLQFIEELESRLLLSSSTSALPLVIRNTSLPSSSIAADDGGFSPAQIRSAYGLSSIVGDGTGQTIAIVDAYNDPNIQADLHTFDLAYSLPDTTLTVLNQTGGTKLPGVDPLGALSTWATEISLDVEWAHAIAPGANIILFEATTNSDINLFTAVNTARNTPSVSVMSLSFGQAETSALTSHDATLLTPAGHIGITVLTSAGDHGAFESEFTFKDVGYPASSPNVISVGGTSLTLDSSDAYSAESAWGSDVTSGFLGGGGGGISVYETEPAYQKLTVTQTTTKRALPDVSIVADPATGVSVLDSFDSPDSPWMTVGGTSASSPIWGGIIAITDQLRVAAGHATLTTAQTLALLYTSPSTNFHDVTTGSNGFAAGTGYDLATGLGTPIANLLIPYLASTPGVTPTPTTTPTIGAFDVTPNPIVSGTALTLTATNVAETVGTVASVNFYMESNTTTSLQTSSDTFLGTGTQSGTTWTLSGNTTGFAPGKYTYYAIATDAANVNSAVKADVVTVVAPTISSFTVKANTINFVPSITLTANNVAEAAGGTISTVNFYRESNNTTGLQTSTDTLVGVGVQSGSNWSLVTSVAGLAAGKYTYYAVATDAAGITSTPATALLSVTVSGNNNFVNSTILVGNTVSVTGSNVNATKELGEPTIAGLTGGKSVWYSWTATYSGPVTVDTKGSGFDTLLGVYTGTAVNGLHTVATNDDASKTNLTSIVTFTAVAGTTYRIVVDGYHGASGFITLNITAAVPVANDSITNATILVGSPISLTTSNVGTTLALGDPLTFGTHTGSSIWFAWTATADSIVHLTTAGSNFNTMLAVYTGTPSALTALASNDDVSTTNLTSALSFQAVTGTTYYFAVEGYNGATGNVVLNLTTPV